MPSTALIGRSQSREFRLSEAPWEGGQVCSWRASEGPLRTCTQAHVMGFEIGRWSGSAPVDRLDRIGISELTRAIAGAARNVLATPRRNERRVGLRIASLAHRHGGPLRPRIAPSCAGALGEAVPVDVDGVRVGGAEAGVVEHGIAGRSG